MCLIPKRGLRKYTRRKPLKAWKIFSKRNDQYHSQYRSFRYRAGLNCTNKPAYSNKDGFYAYKTKVEALRSRFHYRDVVRRVYMLGIVVEHRNGYRAEKLFLRK